MDRVPDHGRLAGPAPGCPHWPPAGRRDTLETGRFARGWARLGGCKIPRFLNGFTQMQYWNFAHMLLYSYIVHCIVYKAVKVKLRCVTVSCDYVSLIFKVVVGTWASLKMVPVMFKICEMTKILFNKLKTFLLKYICTGPHRVKLWRHLNIFKMTIVMLVHSFICYMLYEHYLAELGKWACVNFKAPRQRQRDNLIDLEVQEKINKESHCV